jgi:hypothetical protein
VNNFMRTFLFIFVLTVVRVFADDTNFFPLLQCQNRTYTNAHIDRITPATVTIFWDGGGERISITNLPVDLQRRLNYDPAAAENYLQDIAAKKAGRLASDQKTLALIAEAQRKLGPAERIRVLKIVSPTRVQILTTNGQYLDAYIHNLPPDVITFLKDYAATFARVSAEQYGNANATYYRTVGRGASAVNVRTRELTDEAASIQIARNHLAELTPQFPSKTTMLSAPSAYQVSPGVRQWEFISMLQP